MLFSEPIFLFLFLPFLLAGIPLCSHHHQNYLLAAASLLFYAWDEPSHALILIGSITFNYGAGLVISKAAGALRRRTYLILGIMANLGVLAWFKYADFLVENLNLFFNLIGLSALAAPASSLPLGISFFTFQAISYLFDVFRRRTPAQTNLIDLTLYVALFPQLIAGPIVRYGEFAWQILNRRITRRGTTIGIRRFVRGLAKKLLIANTLAVPADAIFALAPSDLTAPIAWLGVLCYTLQIYFDFSGYSDMAIGLGRMFGFKIPENFRHPYTATSITGFWRRWHMSLSRWFRDYLYIPLGGNRTSPNRTYLNLTIVFLFCGLWHGASWTFVLWGMVHGAALIFERMGLGATLARSPRLIGWIYTMLLIVISWVLFRSPSIAHAIGYLIGMAGFAPGSTVYVEFGDYFRPSVALAIALGCLFATPFREWCRAQVGRFIRSATDRPTGWTRLRWTHHAMDTACLVLLLTCCVWVAASTYVPFLYFRF